jgi:molybdate transport system substrate-binding protein
MTHRRRLLGVFAALPIFGGAIFGKTGKAWAEEPGKPADAARPTDAARSAPALRTVTVFAPPSLQNALKEIAAALAKSGGPPIAFTFANTAVLSRQIVQGTLADIFVSSDARAMDELAKRALIQPASRRDILSNRLALIARKESPIRLQIAPWFPLLQALGGSKLAMADNLEPAGADGQAALTALNVWTQVQSQVVRADSVRSALGLVTLGEAPLAIVYETDALAEPAVRIVDLFPETSHPQIVYPIALTRAATPGAGEVLTFIEGPQARAIFERYGFKRLP